MKDDELAELILQVCHNIPDWLSIEENILKPLNRNEDFAKIMIARKRLVMMGLIEEKHPNHPSSQIKITPKGFFAIQNFDTLDKYLKEEKKLHLTERDIRYLQERNIRLKNLNIIVGILSFITGSITGLLLSDPIRNILRQWMEAG